MKPLLLLVALLPVAFAGGIGAGYLLSRAADRLDRVLAEDQALSIANDGHDAAHCPSTDCPTHGGTR